MARAARGHGVEIELDAGVHEVIVEGDRATGVILDNGETVRAKYVVSGVNPKLLYTRLVPSGALAPEFLERITRWRNGSGTFRMNVALSALPSFTALPGDGDHLTAGIILGPSLDYMDRAWQDARERGWSRRAHHSPFVRCADAFGSLCGWRRETLRQRNSRRQRL